MIKYLLFTLLFSFGYKLTHAQTFFEKLEDNPNWKKYHSIVQSGNMGWSTEYILLNGKIDTIKTHIADELRGVFVFEYDKFGNIEKEFEVIKVSNPYHLKLWSDHKNKYNELGQIVEDAFPYYLYMETGSMLKRISKAVKADSSTGWVAEYRYDLEGNLKTEESVKYSIARRKQFQSALTIATATLSQPTEHLTTQ